MKYLSFPGHLQFLKQFLDFEISKGFSQPYKQIAEELELQKWYY